ncbi:hypothetical protein TW86_22475 [Halomonas sp. S2151]|uniref:hypothetical protein n=1 Tax=Halomonas sp. S2151 TaxID=579478 RepID=UPI0005FA2D28|nr:hypothetical protein [Halomonas sp. S2151]KJZ04016.1 hypothetical protein TW86_22475 [Halomonas sp. S2151]
MNAIFSGLHAINGVLLGFPFLFAILVFINTGIESLEQPWMQLFLPAFPVVFMALIYVQKHLERKKER